MKGIRAQTRGPSASPATPPAESHGPVRGLGRSETVLFAAGFSVLALGLALSIWGLWSHAIVATAVVVTLAVATILLFLTTTRLAQARRDRGAAEGFAESVLATAPDGIVTIDESGTVLSANPAIEQMLGWTEDDLVGRNVSVLMPPPHRERHDGYLERYVSTGFGSLIGIARDVRGLKRDGTTIPLRLRVGERTTGQGRLFTGVLTDLSERERAEDALGESNMRLREVLDAATEVAIIATDVTGTITNFNRGAERMLGFRASDLIGRTSPVAFHLSTEIEERGREMSREAGRTIDGFAVFAERARVGGHEEREWTYVRKDGSRLTVVLSVTAMKDSRGKLSGFLGIARDVTEQKRVERLKSDFISTVSHELRTPLTSIRGSLGLLEAGGAGELPESARTLVGIAHRNSERLVRIINDILDMEKIESGQLAFTFSSVDLAGLLANAVEMNQPLAFELGTRIELEDGCPTVRLRIDVDRILQVLTNLLANAVKHSSRDLPVTASASVAGRFVRITVRDHGPGIPEEFRARIFQKFAQADSSDRRLRGGTGLGLAISKAIVERHGGRLGYETAPGWGTAFHVDLPRVLQTGAIPIFRPVSMERRALVCDDDPEVVQLLSLLLEREGLAVDVAGTGARARALLSDRSYAAMTLDIGLPEDDGIALLQWLREQPRTESLPVVAVSARVVEGLDGLDGGVVEVVDWMTGPIDEPRLRAAVRRGLGPTTGRMPRILHVADDPGGLSLVRRLVSDLAEVEEEPAVAAAGRRLSTEPFDLVLLSLAVPDGSGLEIPQTAATAGRPAVPVVVYPAGGEAGPLCRRSLASFAGIRTTGDRLLATLRTALARGVQESPPLAKETP